MSTWIMIFERGFIWMTVKEFFQLSSRNLTMEIIWFRSRMKSFQKRKKHLNIQTAETNQLRYVWPFCCVKGETLKCKGIWLKYVIHSIASTSINTNIKTTVSHVILIVLFIKHKKKKIEIGSGFFFSSLTSAVQVLCILHARRDWRAR